MDYKQFGFLEFSNVDINWLHMSMMRKKKALSLSGSESDLDEIGFSTVFIQLRVPHDRHNTHYNVRSLLKTTKIKSGETRIETWPTLAHKIFISGLFLCINT